jgi:hypothetical protein
MAASSENPLLSVSKIACHSQESVLSAMGKKWGQSLEIMPEQPLSLIARSRFNSGLVG